MAERTTSVEAAGDARIAAQLEVLRLRNLLIARDAELGELRGRLFSQEQRAHRFASLGVRIPIPGAGRAFGLLTRWLWG